MKNNYNIFWLKDNNTILKFSNIKIILATNN